MVASWRKLPWGVNPIATLRFLPSGDGAGVDRSARIADETDQRHGVVAQWSLAHRETLDARGATPCRGSLVTERPVVAQRRLRCSVNWLASMFLMRWGRHEGAERHIEVLGADVLVGRLHGVADEKVERVP